VSTRGVLKVVPLPALRAALGLAVAVALVLHRLALAAVRLLEAAPLQHHLQEHSR
jgi:hypothetical protein